MAEQTSSRVKRFLIEFALPFLGLLAICVINSWIVQKLFSVSLTGYLSWYVSAGPFIGIALVAFGAAWGALDNNVGLVSANPTNYVKACSKLAGLSIYAFGGHLQSKNHDGLSFWDVLFGLPLIAVFVIASFGWLLLIAPLQYFLFLVCGAPSRIALRSRYRLHAEVKGKILEYTELKPHEPWPETGWDASMRDKPVTLANAFGAAALFVIGHW